MQFQVFLEKSKNVLYPGQQDKGQIKAEEVGGEGRKCFAFTLAAPVCIYNAYTSLGCKYVKK